MTTILTREDVCNIDPYYKYMLEREDYHDHIIVRDTDGIIRWQENPETIQQLNTCEQTWGFNLNHLRIAQQVLGLPKNSRYMKKVYRDIGYSLSGYSEVFNEE